jgi:hypothetical protein
MKRFFHITLMFMLSLAIAFTNSSAVLADGEDGEHALEMQVHGYHVTLASQNEWAQGENTLVVTLKDRAGLPLRNANVEISIGPTADEHAAPDDEHGAPEAASAHGSQEGHSSMPGMELDEPAGEASDLHASNEVTNLLSLKELDEHGTYVVDTHLETSGTQEIHVMFHANGEMLQADFVVEIPGDGSKTVVLWGFVAVNALLIASAGIMKKQSISAKGR